MNKRLRKGEADREMIGVVVFLVVVLLVVGGPTLAIKSVTGMSLGKSFLALVFACILGYSGFSFWRFWLEEERKRQEAIRERDRLANKRYEEKERRRREEEINNPRLNGKPEVMKVIGELRLYHAGVLPELGGRFTTEQFEDLVEKTLIRVWERSLNTNGPLRKNKLKSLKDSIVLVIDKHLQLERMEQAFIEYEPLVSSHVTREDYERYLQQNILDGGLSDDIRDACNNFVEMLRTVAHKTEPDRAAALAEKEREQLARDLDTFAEQFREEKLAQGMSEDDIEAELAWIRQQHNVV